jgi:hypothetical protein
VVFKEILGLAVENSLAVGRKIAVFFPVPERRLRQLVCGRVIVDDNKSGAGRAIAKPGLPRCGEFVVELLDDVGDVGVLEVDLNGQSQAGVLDGFQGKIIPRLLEIDHQAACPVQGRLLCCLLFRNPLHRLCRGFLDGLPCLGRHVMSDLKRQRCRAGKFKSRSGSILTGHFRVRRASRSQSHMWKNAALQR